MELIWRGNFSTKIKLPTSLHNLARRTLRMIAAVAKMETLKIPPNKKLERLRGVREGLWSSRINDYWRICFRRQNGSAHDVEISDYHSGEVMK